MTEPVAYLQLDIHGKEMVHIEKDMNGYETKPLYTAEQLHPHVKMTQKQYDRLVWDKSHTNLLACIDYFFEHDDNYKLGLPTENLRGKLTQEDIARAWLNPDETIEIVPNMKWFVRSKKSFPENGKYLYLDSGEIHGHYAPDYHQLDVSYATKFDTKEEAEEWTNPLTEAVQLPVDGDND